MFNKIKTKFNEFNKKYYDFKTKGAGKTMFYGRFRRMELAKKVAYVLIGIVVLFIIISFLSKKIDVFIDHNVNFAYLKNYFNNQGYDCIMIERDGGKCVLEGEVSTTMFTRFDEGFTYILKTDSYVVNIRHVVNTYNDIIFTTTKEALPGYRNMTYNCYTSDGITGDLDSCSTNNGSHSVKLDSELYLSVIENHINSLNDIINASGYDRDELLNNYYWKK
ncbi:MAG: hypothetical protein ACI4WW_08255 [Candidatus Coprovivens sp.]